MTTRHERTAVDLIRNNLGGGAPVQPHYTLARTAQHRAGDNRMPFVLSSPKEARDGMTLDLTKMDLTNFRKNPALLWQHGYDLQRGSLPIGRWHNVRIAHTGELVGEAEFDRADPFAADIERRYKEGWLTSVSISWMFTSRDASELLEVSAVAIPADPDARKRARSLWVVGDAQRRQVGGEVIARKGDGALVSVQPQPNVSTSDRLSVLRRRAEPELLLQEVEVWALMNRTPPFRHPRARNAENVADKARSAINAIRDAFNKGDITADRARRDFDEVWRYLRDFARTVPPLDQQMSDYILSGKYAEDLDNYQGDIT